MMTMRYDGAMARPLVRKGRLEVRTSEGEETMITALQRRLGATRAGVVHQALRELAVSHGIPLPEADTALERATDTEKGEGNG